MRADILEMAPHPAPRQQLPRQPRAQDIDRHIGGRLRQRRVMNGLTQQGLASAGPGEPSPQQRVFLDLARNFRSIRKRKHQEAICLLARILATVENPTDIDAWDLMPGLAESA